MCKSHLPSTEALVAHALITLPDSLTARRRLLVQCRAALPLNNPLRQHCKTMLELFDQLDALQIKFAYERSEGGSR